MQSSDVFEPKSPLARATLDLFNASLVVSAIIFLLVTVLVLYCVWRFRGLPGAAEPRQLFGHKRLEIVWTVIPFLVLVYLFVLTLRAMNASDPPVPNENPDIIIIGHQFWWEVRYPKSGIVTANEIHLPTGHKLLFQVQAADVIHSFWIPQLGRKMDTLPDQVRQIWLQANEPGTYLGACSEFCGLQHAWMRIMAIADSPQDFEQWQRARLQPPASSPAAERGLQVFQQLTCVNCHSVRGLPPSRQAGPDLSHLASRRTLGAGVLANSPENLARWIQNPQAFKPGSLMPAMALTDAQQKDLLAFLETMQ